MLIKLRDQLNTSIQAKIAATLLIAVLTAVTLTAVTAAVREADRSFDSKKAELGGIAAALAASVAQDLRDRNPAGVGRTLTAIRRIPNVTFAQVLDAQGRSIFQLGDSVILERHGHRVEANEDIGPFSAIFLRNYIAEAPIVSGGERIGTLRLIANISDLGSALGDALYSALVAGAIAALVGLLLSQRLQHRITEPVNRLTAAISGIRATQNFAVTVPRTSRDETGLMVDAFNDMLSHIRARDRRLAEHRDRLEAEVDERTAELRAATVAAQSANAAKSEFLATMSHEIRTPLNGMLVMAELLASGDLPDRLQRHADVIVGSGQTLLAIINDILDLSKIEAGRLELEILPVDAEAIADQVMSLFAARAASKGLDLACYIAPGVPARIAADPVRLNQVLSNLVNNALKFTQAGSVTLSVAPDGEPAAAGAPCRLRFSVTDTGIGIPEDKLATIFEPFTQADQSTTRRFGGTGIGLSISRKLVAAMGGEITVVSVAGQGSTFSFTIAAEALELSARGAEPGFKSALVAMPCSASRRVLADALRDAGCQVLEADDLEPDALAGAKTTVIFAEPSSAAPVLQSHTGPRPRIVLVTEVGDVSAGVLIDDLLADSLLLRPLTRRDITDAVAAADTANTQPAGARKGRAKEPLKSFVGIHALAADDSAVNREVLSEALGRLDVRLTLVADGAAAVAAVKDQRFDIVLMDCSMPVMDGYAATRAIRDCEAVRGGQPVPIVALTAHVAGTHANAWREAGMNDTLSKPFTLRSLAGCLERWTPPREAASRTAGAVSGDWKDPVLDAKVFDDIREMQGPDDDLVGRIAGLFRIHAPASLERLAAALASCDTASVAEMTHALKSLCRNIGAVRLGNYLHDVEDRARGGTLPDRDACLAETKRHLDDVLALLPQPAKRPAAQVTATG